MPTPNCDSPPVVDDDDLQSLDWLQNFNTNFLLSSLQSDDYAMTVAIKTETETSKIERQSTKNSFPTLIAQTSSSAIRQISSKQRKPLQCTFNCMIFRAIETSPYKALQLHSIYDWIADKHNYFKTAGLQWRNSVRHCLSLNRCFYRLNIDLPDESGTKTNRSSWWTVHPDFRDAYGKMVLDEGPTHRCLPRGVTNGFYPNFSPVRRLSTSEKELAALANDIKAAAAILALSQKHTIINNNHNANNNGSNENVQNEKKSGNDKHKQQRKRRSGGGGGQTTTKSLRKIINKHNRKVQNRVAQQQVQKKNNRVQNKKRNSNRRNVFEQPVEFATVETQTDEVRIPPHDSIFRDEPNYFGSVKVEFIDQDDEQSQTKSDNSSGILTRSRKRILLNDKHVDDICASDVLLKLAEQKCPMDQELI